MNIRLLITISAMLGSNAVAQSQMSTPAFRIIDSVSAFVHDVPELVSYDNGVAELSFSRSGMTFSQPYASRPYLYWDGMTQRLTFEVSSGYRITGISVSGVVDGILKNGVSSFAWADVSLDGVHNRVAFNNVTSPRAFVTGVGDTWLDGTFDMGWGIVGEVHSSPTEVDYCDDYYCGSTPVYDPELGVRFGDVRMSVYTSAEPVPEPSTYALMVAGLAVVAVAGLRRKSVRFTSVAAARESPDPA